MSAIFTVARRLAEVVGLLCAVLAWAVWYCLLCPPAQAAAAPPALPAWLDRWSTVGALTAPLWLILLGLAALLLVEALRPPPRRRADPFRDGPALPAAPAREPR
jgi:hypothetical protein